MLANILEPENKLLYSRKSGITDDNELVNKDDDEDGNEQGNASSCFIQAILYFVSFLLCRTSTQNDQIEFMWTTITFESLFTLLLFFFSAYLWLGITYLEQSAHLHLRACFLFLFPQKPNHSFLETSPQF